MVKYGGSLLGDGNLGGGVVADLLDALALLADDAPAEAIVRQHLQYHLPDQRREQRLLAPQIQTSVSIQTRIRISSSYRSLMQFVSFSATTNGGKLL